jgi:hypothetical protein
MTTTDAAGRKHDTMNSNESAKRSALAAALNNPWIIALGIAAIYSIRFLYCLPFSGYTRLFNYETVTTLTSYLIYAGEPFSFPLGAIKRLTFPFEDANVGNVGALPLFAIFFKAAGTLVPYFKAFDYFELVEIISSFLTAYFAQMILLALGVRSVACRALGAFLTATSMLILCRSAWLQPFCVVAFPLFTGWIYGMLLTLWRTQWQPKQDALILCLFPAAALTDNYTLWALLLGTAVLTLREAFEAFFSELPASRNRLARLLFLCAGGVTASLLCLFVVGMYPLPPTPSTFSSYDFGMGGRYHVADLFAPWIPVANKVSGFMVPSLLGRLGFPLTTDQLGAGQYEGVGYIGTPVVLLWMVISIVAMVSLAKRVAIHSSPDRVRPRVVVLHSPWKKVVLAALCVFAFSLGYELHILGKTFPNFSGMPAAWIADRVPSLYNFRAPGRLAALLSLVLILEAVRRLSMWQNSAAHSQYDWLRRLPWTTVLAALALLHLIEVAPLLRPIPAQPMHPVGGIFTNREIETLHQLAVGRDAVVIAPSVLAVDTQWTTVAFSVAYYMGLRSNLYYLARTIPDHSDLISNDISRVMAGDWDSLTKAYGSIAIVVRAVDTARLRDSMSDRYRETVVGPVSVWSKRQMAR